MNHTDRRAIIRGAAQKLARALAPLRGEHQWREMEQRVIIAGAMNMALKRIGLPEVRAVVSVTQTASGVGPVAPAFVSDNPHQQHSSRAIAAALWQFLLGEQRRWKREGSGEIEFLTRAYQHILESVSEWIEPDVTLTPMQQAALDPAYRAKAVADTQNLKNPRGLADTAFAQKVAAEASDPECWHPDPMPVPEPLHLFSVIGTKGQHQKVTYVVAPSAEKVMEGLEGDYSSGVVIDLRYRDVKIVQ